MIELRPEIEEMDTQHRNLFTHLFDTALGNPISLSAAPTTVGKELKPNTLGHNGTKLYINIDGTTYSISLTAV